MPEREYFSLRYLAPGFSFILIVIGLNYAPIIDILKATASGTNENALGLVLSLVSLLASSAIGFLISQFWFAWFNGRRIDARIYEPLEKTMNAKLGWKLGRKGKERDQALSSIMDYMLLRGEEKEWKYCQRKWDIYMLLGCTLASLVLGVIVGLISRVTLNSLFYLVEPSKWLNAFQSLDQVAKIDIMLFVFTLISVLFLGIVLSLTKGQAFGEYYPMMEILINRNGSKSELKQELKEAFPDLFEEKNE